MAAEAEAAFRGWCSGTVVVQVEKEDLVAAEGRVAHSAALPSLSRNPADTHRELARTGKSSKSGVRIAKVRTH